MAFRSIFSLSGRRHCGDPGPVPTINNVPCGRPIVSGFRHSGAFAMAQVARPTPELPLDLTFGTRKMPESPVAAKAEPSATP